MVERNAILAVLGLLVLAGLAATPAQAEEGFFYSHEQNTIVTGEAEGTQTFALTTTKGGTVKVECAKAKLAGTNSGEELADPILGTVYRASTFTVHPEYYGGAGPGTKCGGFAVTTTGCHLELSASIGEAEPHAQMAIQCGAGAIEISVLGCVAKIPTQVPATGGARITNDKVGGTAAWRLKLAATAAGISFTTNGAPGCELMGLPKEGTATYTGSLGLDGYEDQEATETGVYVEGSRTGIWRGPLVDSFHSHEQNTIVTGGALGSQVFSIVPGVPFLTCAGATLAGTVSAEEEHTGGELGTTYTSELTTVHPEYFGAGGPSSKCLVFEMATSQPVKTTGCHFGLTSVESAGRSPVHLECGSGAIEIEFSFPLGPCVFRIPSQTPAGGVSYESNRGGETDAWDLTANFELEGMRFTSKGKGCEMIGLPKEGEGKEATLTGEFTVRGYVDLEETETGVYEDGAATGIWKGPTE